MDYIFHGLNPQCVLRNFWDLSQIYSRRPDNTQGISNYLADFGKKSGLKVYQDEFTNVIIYKDATPGYEQSPTVMLGAHMDMVCATAPGVQHDFDNEPLELILDDDGDTIHAAGTTLGADCGLGMAFILAVLESKSIAHPAIEAVFTANEETDMKGALKLDYSHLNSKIILSLDATRLSLGGAGELDTEHFLPINRTPAKETELQASISIGNLIGGHSGKNAFAERGNANTLLVRMLSDLEKKLPFRLVSFVGGHETACALAREAVCVISFEKDYLEIVQTEISEWDALYKSELAVPDPNVTLTMQVLDTVQDPCDEDTTRRFITFMTVMPDGLCSLHKYFEHKYETCVNLGVVEMQENGFHIIACIRSAIAAKKYFQYDKIRRICELLDVTCTVLHDLPQWEYNSNSRLSEIISPIYSDLEPNIAQGTCEQGIFLMNMPGAEAAGVGPVVDSPHSPNEKISIISLRDDWKRFLKVLAAIKNY